MVESASPTCLVNFLKTTNLLNAGFLMFSAAWWFFEVTTKTCPESGSEKPGCFTQQQCFCAIYICMFSSLLLAFELRCRRFDTTIYAMFGFMFSWFGRLAFFFFVGTLAFTLGPMGYAAGGFTVVNIIFNYYCLAHNEAYKSHIKAMGREALFHAKEDHFKTKGVEMKPQGAAVPDANGNPTGPDWERFHDPDSNSYYYYNHVTQVTQWEQVAAV